MLGSTRSWVCRALNELVPRSYSCVERLSECNVAISTASARGGAGVLLLIDNIWIRIEMIRHRIQVC